MTLCLFFLFFSTTYHAITMYHAIAMAVKLGCSEWKGEGLRNNLSNITRRGWLYGCVKLKFDSWKELIHRRTFTTAAPSYGYNPFNLFPLTPKLWFLGCKYLCNNFYSVCIRFSNIISKKKLLFTTKKPERCVESLNRRSPFNSHVNSEVTTVVRRRVNIVKVFIVLLWWFVFLKFYANILYYFYKKNNENCLLISCVVIFFTTSIKTAHKFLMLFLVE